MRSQLLQAELADKELRATYEIKSEQAANLDEYKAQVEEINQRIEGMLAQLPKTLDVPNLIEDISKMGISAGLEFKSIRPQPEIEQDYYTELPLAITVTGTYHQLAEFVSNLASLQRIVTLDDFTITRPKVDRSIQRLREVAQSKNIQLSMDITAKTYKQSRSFKKNQSAGQQGQVTNASN